MQDKQLAHSLWLIDLYINAHRLCDVWHVRNLSLKGIDLLGMCKMRFNPSKVLTRPKDILDREEDEWFTDQELIQQIKEDPKKAQQLRQIYAFAGALVPDMFRSNNDAKSFETIAKNMGRDLERQASSRYKALWDPSIQGAWETNMPLEQLYLMVERMGSFRMLWNNLKVIKDMMEPERLEFCAPRHLSATDRILIGEIHQSANGPFQAAAKAR